MDEGVFDLTGVGVCGLGATDIGSVGGFYATTGTTCCIGGITIGCYFFIGVWNYVVVFAVVVILNGGGISTSDWSYAHCPLAITSLGCASRYLLVGVCANEFSVFFAGVFIASVAYSIYCITTCIITEGGDGSLSNIVLICIRIN